MSKKHKNLLYFNHLVDVTARGNGNNRSPTVHVEKSYSSRAPGLTSGLQGSVNVHRGALFLVP